MWDFNLTAAFGLMARTAPYLLLRAAIYGGMATLLVLVTGLSSGVGWGIGGVSGPDGRPAGALWGGLIGLGATGGAIYLAREYILYQVKAAHIAALIALMDGHEIPAGKNQLAYGAGVVKDRFVQSSVLFGIDRLVKGVLAAITGLMEGIATFLPIPGLQNIVGLIRAFLKIAVGFADEIILAYAIRTNAETPWSAAREALVYYGQNHKLLLKNAAWLAAIVYGLSFFIFLLLLAPAAAIAWFLPGAWSAGGLLFALIFAWAIKTALIEPLAITCMMQVYFGAIENQTPAPEWQARLEALSGKFSKLQQKAANWVGKASTPAPSPAATQAP